MLHRRIHRKKRVRDHLQPRHRLPHPHLRPKASQPPNLHLRQRQHLADSRNHKLQARVIPRGKRLHRPLQPVIQKHLIHNQRQPMPRTQLLQLHALGSRRRMPGRIVRMNQHHRPRPRPDPLLQLGKVDPPAKVVKQRVIPQRHMVERRQKIEQRIARLRYQHLVARVAQQPKQKAISLACTRSQDHPPRVNLCTMLRIVPAHSLPSTQDPTRIGVINHRRRLPKRAQDRPLVVHKPAHSRVRNGQVDQFFPTRPSPPHCRRERPFTRIPRRPRRESSTHPPSLERNVHR